MFIVFWMFPSGRQEEEREISLEKVTIVVDKKTITETTSLKDAGFNLVNC